MAGQLAGPGQGFPLSQGLYPAFLLNGALQPGTNAISLPPGCTLPVPRGNWAVDLGGICFLQWLNPQSGRWENVSSARMGAQYISVADGFDIRVANLTGCAIAAVVTAGGSGYPATGTTVTPSAGNSQWQAVVGGALSGVSITAAGSGYGVPPLVIFPAPPVPGVPATGYATIANGTLSALTMTNEGAGYTGTLVKPSIYPSPLDPNYLSGSITNATAQVTITGSGSLTAVLCTNSGASFSSLPTLTVAGTGGSAAAASICQLTTLTGATISGAGGGFNSSAFLTTVGGQPSYTPQWTNPSTELTGYIPRPALATLTLGSGTITSINTIIDGGLFLGAPTAVVLQGGLAPTTASTIALATGGATATVMLQPLG